MEVEPRDGVFGKLAGGAVGAEPLPGVPGDEGVLVDEGEVVGRDVGEADAAAQGIPGGLQCGKDGPAGCRDGGERVVGLDAAEDVDRIVGVPGARVRVTPVVQDFGGEQAEDDAEEQGRFERLVRVRVLGGLEHVDKEPVEFRVDLALDGREETEVYEVELMGPVDGAERLRAVDGVGVPVSAVRFEQGRHLVEGHVLAQGARRRIAPDLPKGQALAVDHEQERCAERPALGDERRCLAAAA